MILVAQRGEYVGKLIVLSLDESEKIIYDKIMKIVGESDICVDKTLLKEQDGDEESYISVDNEENLQAVFNIFKEKFISEFDFID